MSRLSSRSLVPSLFSLCEFLSSYDDHKMVKGLLLSLLWMERVSVRVVNHDGLRFSHSGTQMSFAVLVWQLVSHFGPELLSTNFNLALFNFSDLYF